MRERPTKKLLITSFAIFTLVGLLFTLSDDTIDGSTLDGSTLSNVAESTKTAAVRDEGPLPRADFDPFALPLVFPEVETAADDISSAVAGARWAEHVTVTMNETELRFESNGLPNHEFPNPFLESQGRSFSAPVAWADFTELDRTVELTESEIDQVITLNPILAATPTETPAGLIGVLINGAQLFSDGDDFADYDIDSYETGYVDICNGHPIAADPAGTGAGTYHYHAVPTCTTDGIDVEGQHSSMVGVMIDGFPVYGSNDEGGDAVSSWDLDECSGHFGPTPEFPDGIYHYHLLDEVTPNPVPCLAGELTTLTFGADEDSKVEAQRGE